MKAVATALVWVGLLGMVSAEMRLWVSRTGVLGKGKLVAVEGDAVAIVTPEGKRRELSNHELITRDQRAVQEWLHCREKAEAALVKKWARAKVGSGSGPSQEPKLGEVVSYEVAVTSETMRTIVGREGDPVPAKAVVRIAYPETFQAAGWNPVLVACAAPSPGEERAGAAALEGYVNEGLAAGCVVLAVDADVVPERDTVAFRWALLQAALVDLRQSWPGAKEWPVVCCGRDGGAVRAANLAAILVRAGYVAGGLHLSGIDRDVVTPALGRFGPDEAAFKAVPVFLAGGGDGDGAVEAALTGGGFDRVRRQEDAEGLGAALGWLLAGEE